MARFVNNFNKGLELGYGNTRSTASTKDETAYEKYIREHYGPDVTSHRDPIALARAAAGQVGSSVWGGVKAGAGFLGHAAAGLMGVPQGPGRATNTGGGIGSDASITARNTPSNRQYGDAAVSAGLSSAGSSGSGYGNANDVGSRISSDLQRDFGLTANQAAGIVGNLGHESGGFRHYQEINPIGGGRGGAGWAQWTNTPGSPRRTAFENYTKQNNLHPQSYEANYGFLKKELTGSHAGALAAVKKTNTIQDAVYAFERKFERANPKYVNYASRMKFANNLGTSSTPSNTVRDPQVAQLQRDLNAAGANLEVDGIAGPLTRAAQQKYSGTAYASTTQDEGRVPTAGVAGQAVVAGQRAPVQLAYADTAPSSSPALGAARGVTIRQSPASPYTNTTGSSFTSGRGDEGTNVRAVPVNSVITPTVYSRTNYNRELPSYTTTDISVPSGTPRTVPTQAVPYNSNMSVPLTGGFNPPTPQQQQDARMPRPRPSYVPGQSSYTSGRGDEGVIPRAGVQGPVPQTPRPPQPRPGYQQPVSYTPFTPAPVQPVSYTPFTPAPVQQAPLIARIPQARPPGLQWSQLQQSAPVQQAVPAGGLMQIVRQAVHEAMSSRDGGGSRSVGASYSGSGGNYSGGNYGGSGGSRITEGIGGGYRNR